MKKRKHANGVKEANSSGATDDKNSTLLRCITVQKCLEAQRRATAGPLQGHCSTYHDHNVPNEASAARRNGRGRRRVGLGHVFNQQIRAQKVAVKDELGVAVACHAKVDRILAALLEAEEVRGVDGVMLVVRPIPVFGGMDVCVSGGGEEK